MAQVGECALVTSLCASRDKAVWPLDRSKPMSYDEFERFAYACIPYDLEVAGADASLLFKSLLSLCSRERVERSQVLIGI